LKVFLIRDALTAAKAGQKVPAGYYNVGTMVGAVLRQGGTVGVCGSCIDAQGITEAEPLGGARRSSMEELTSEAETRAPIDIWPAALSLARSWERVHLWGEGLEAKLTGRATGPGNAPNATSCPSAGPWTESSRTWDGALAPDVASRAERLLQDLDPPVRSGRRLPTASSIRHPLAPS
jgi:hypothetical protein